LKIGVQKDTSVSFSTRDFDLVHDDEDLRVTQAYCSALSCQYSGVENAYWEDFARLVLEAAYEATLWTSVHVQYEGKGNNRVYLTFLGGGVFGNDPRWIADSIGRACAILDFHGADLEILVCHYKAVNHDLMDYIDSSYARYKEKIVNEGCRYH